MTSESAHASLWGGGYSEAMHPALAAISHSLPQDMPLGVADLQASAAYARALGGCGVLSTADAERLADALLALRAELAAGDWVPSGAEDIHTAIEAEITRRLGPLGERLHTGRSRNDQVSTAFRLALGERLHGIVAAVRGLQAMLVRRAEAHTETLMPSYTHLQRAQPIVLGHWLLAHFWPLQRDVQRLHEVIGRVMRLPLGVGAVSGHPFGIDRAAMAQALGFAGITENSVDTVGDRDFAVEATFACAMVALHLSRLAEELVIYSSSEFAYVTWPDALSTGSSLMPNKKNPDLAELVRGRAAAAVGDVVSLLVLLKGLPQSYQRDLQEDKPPVWRSTAALRQSLEAMKAAMGAIEFDEGRLAAAVTDDTLATEAADVLVGKGVPFRQAHHIVAACVAEARRRAIGLRDLGKTDYPLPAPLTAQDLDGLQARAALARRHVPGGTAPAAVREQVSQARAALAPSDPRGSR